MGILNITPNSFSSTGRFMTSDAALIHVQQMIKDGATIIDIGGEPTNPGVHPVTSVQAELDRVIPIVEKVAKEFSVVISVDTSKPEVIREAIHYGATLINDVRALQIPGALDAVAATGAAVCLMHMRYPFGKMEDSADNFDQNPLKSIQDFLIQRIQDCVKAGITKDRIVIDPGIGHGNFGKNLQQNLQLIANLDQFKKLGFPILVGVSRKTFIGELLDLPEQDRLYGSIAAAIMAVSNGANIIRTHDVRPTAEAIKVAVKISESIL